MRNFLKKKSSLIIHLLLIGIILYGAGRLYFQLTAGFTESNITTDLSLEPDHQIPSLTAGEKEEVVSILQQPFHYLGKGCQSYVFLSEDGRYVIKFLKLQRFRPQFYLKALSFIPSIEKRFKQKTLEKREKLDALLNSWKIAYNDLKKETGLIYLHLNVEDSFNYPIKIVDKMGFKHTINPKEVAFLVQKRATMLCSEIKDQMAKGDLKHSQSLLDNLIVTLLSEYERGLGDNDHALMQNTGVIENQPLHIDVGQFSKEERFKVPEIYKHEIFSKTYKFRIWLLKHYPDLELYLTTRLKEIIGPEMAGMKPNLKTVDEGA